MANEDEGEGLAAMWDVKLQGLERVDADDPDDGDTFMVDLELLSPGANGSVSVMVSGGPNETKMIAEARGILQAALERWGRIMAGAPGGAPIAAKEA